MAIEAAAALTVQFLAPHLVKGGIKVVQGASQQLGEKAKELYDALKERWAGDQFKEQILSRLEEDSQSPHRRRALQNLLEEEMEADAEFASTIRTITQGTTQIRGNQAIASGAGSVAVGGSVTNSFIKTEANSRNVSAQTIRDATIVTGDNNTVSYHHTLSAIKPEDINIQEVIFSLREVLSQLNAPRQTQIDNALAEAEAEAQKPEPNKDEVGLALERGLKYANQANEFGASIGKLKELLTPATVWLGSNWDNLWSYLS